jgi:hypothetical protein
MGVKLSERYAECLELYVRFSLHLNNVAVKDGDSFIFYHYPNTFRRIAKNSEQITQNGLLGHD